MKDCADLLRVVVQRCFPADARIIVVSKETDVIFAISWKIRTDPGRPLKRSKIIRLNIEEEVVAEYAHGAVAVRQAFDDRLEQSLREHLTHFNPDHHALEDQVPPVVDWLVNANK